MILNSVLKTKLRTPAILTFGVSLVLFIAGCGPADATPTAELDEVNGIETYPDPNLEASTTAESYPAPTLSTSSVVAYPISTPFLEVESPYPGPEETNVGILLALAKPIRVSDQNVEGVGPPGLIVFIINITFMGELLGSGAINDDGTFSVLVDGLEPGIQVGLTADIEAFGLTSDEVTPGEGQINVPQVGYFYDTYVIRE